MIRHTTTLKALRSQIKVASSNWFIRAQAILDRLPANPRSKDFRTIWSEIKDIYINLQHSKCAFCEKPLEGRIEQDVEHFRPKTEVEHWTVPADLLPELSKAGVAIGQAKDGSSEPGYRFLAYLPFNYAAACKPCNSVLKGNFFPVVGPRMTDAKEPPAPSSERALLIYPVGTIDVDPESLITFVEGVVPQPLKKSGFGRVRALVTIAVFRLGDPIERKVFFQGRARAIQHLYLNLRAMQWDPDPAIADAATRNVTQMLSPAAPFASCLRSFHRLFHDSPDEAREVFSRIAEFLDKNSP